MDAEGNLVVWTTYRTRSDLTFLSRSRRFSNSEFSNFAFKTYRASGLAACLDLHCLSTVQEFGGPILETGAYRPG